MKDVKTITFPSTVRQASSCSFAETSLSSVVLNEGLEMIGEHCDFGYQGTFCETQLRRILLPSTLKLIGYGTFYGCDQLKCVEFQKGSRLWAIGTCAFNNCVSLKGICLPEGLEFIGGWCFFRTGLEEIAIPSSVTTIDACVF